MRRLKCARKSFSATQGNFIGMASFATYPSIRKTAGTQSTLANTNEITESESTSLKSLRMAGRFDTNKAKATGIRNCELARKMCRWTQANTGTWFATQ